MLDFELFRRVIDEAGPSLVRIDFFNYGEAFLHKRAVEMCEYIKTQFPHIYLYTSTNGLAFTEEQVRRLVHSGIDEVTFSIDGATPESYVKYRQRGDFAKAIRNLAPGCRREAQRRAATCRSSTGATSCSSHNDSDEEMQRARADGGRHRRRSTVLGAHRSPGGHVLAPLRAAARPRSRRSARDLGRQQPRETPFRARRRAREIEVRGAAAGAAADRAAPAARVASTTRVRNLSTRPFPAQASYGRRLVRSGAQLCARDGHARSIGTSSARGCRRRSQPGDVADVPMTITAPATAGRYALKFDLVSEGIDWFEACGSPTTTKTLVVI